MNSIRVVRIICSDSDQLKALFLHTTDRFSEFQETELEAQRSVEWENSALLDCRLSSKIKLLTQSTKVLIPRIRLPEIL